MMVLIPLSQLLLADRVVLSSIALVLVLVFESSLSGYSRNGV